MKARPMALCALFAALLALCAWLSIPIGDVAFTLQTFGVALALLLLGGKWGTLCIFVYLMLGAVGLPVFSAFQGGAGILLGATGGYLTGFLVWGLLYWLLTALFPNRALAATLLGLAACYGFGTLWYWQLYLAGEGGSLWAVLLKCVAPYLAPDGIKLALAWLLAKRLKRFV